MAGNEDRSESTTASSWPAAVWEIGIGDVESGAEVMLDRLFASDWPSAP